MTFSTFNSLQFDMDSDTQVCLVLLIVTNFITLALGAKDKELYCGGKL